MSTTDLPVTGDDREITAVEESALEFKILRTAGAPSASTAAVLNPTGGAAARNEEVVGAAARNTDSPSDNSTINPARLLELERLILELQRALERNGAALAPPENVLNVRTSTIRFRWPPSKVGKVKLASQMINICCSLVMLFLSELPTSLLWLGFVALSGSNIASVVELVVDEQ